MGAEWYLDYFQFRYNLGLGVQGWVPPQEPHQRLKIFALFSQEQGLPGNLLARDINWQSRSRGYRASFPGGSVFFKSTVPQGYYLKRTVDWSQAASGGFPKSSGSYTDTYEIIFTVAEKFSPKLLDRTGTEPDPDHPGTLTTTVSYSDLLSSVESASWAEFSAAVLSDEDYDDDISFNSSSTIAEGPDSTSSFPGSTRYKYKVGCELSAAAYAAFSGQITFFWDEREIDDDESFSRGSSSFAYSDQIAEPRYTGQGVYADANIEDLPWAVIESFSAASDANKLHRRISPADANAGNWSKTIAFLPTQTGTEEFSATRLGVMSFGSESITISISVRIIDVFTFDQREVTGEIIIDPTERVTDISSQVADFYTAAEAGFSEFEQFDNEPELEMPSEANAGFVAKAVNWSKYGFEDGGQYWRTEEQNNNNWTITKTLTGHPKFSRTQIVESVADKRGGIIAGKTATPVSVANMPGDRKLILSGDYELQAAPDKNKRIENFRVKIGDREFLQFYF